MAPDSATPQIEANPVSQPHLPHSQAAKAEAPRFKFRIRFRKAHDLRLVSHHDLMHVVERMFRRADITLCISQGFNPRPKMVFALSLALGVAGLNEVLEIEVAETITAEEVERRVSRQCPPGLEILSVVAIDVKKSARVRRAWYHLSLPSPMAELPARCESFLQASDCWVERARPNPRRVNLRPFVSELHYTENNVDLALWITSNGSARPEEVITALGLGDLLEAGAVIERASLELYDELPAGASEPPPLRSAFEEITSGKVVREARPTAIVDNPMSFET